MTKVAIPAELQGIAEAVRAGNTPSRSVRQLLGWFGAQRRGALIVRQIRLALAEAKLDTKPDFAYEYIDSLVSFVARGGDEETEQPHGEEGEGDNDGASELSYNAVSRLAAAGVPPPRLDPQASVARAVTMMMADDVDYIAVMSGEWQAKGVVSWRSIASRQVLGGACDTVGQCMDEPQEVSHHTSMFVASERVARWGYVLVRGAENRIVGMVTAADLSAEFGKLGKPFLLIGEIELMVRDFADGRVEAEDVRAAHQDEERKSDELGDLSFGELARMIDRPDVWPKLGLSVDKKTFMARIERVRTIRNAVMHFDPDGLVDEDLAFLEQTSRFLQRVKRITRA